ncbi:MAG: hypothetical protein SGCHY_003455 [Lobulomycetales sp.]
MQKVLALIALPLHGLVVCLAIYLIAYKTRGASREVRKWSKFKQYYIANILAAIPVTITFSLSLFALNGQDKINVTLFQASGIVLSISFVPLVTVFTFLPIYVHERLYSVLVGTREYSIWKYIKIYIVAVTCAASLSMLAVFSSLKSSYSHLVGDTALSALDELDALIILFFATMSLMFISFGTVTVYCYFKVVWAILSSSSKLARMKKTAEQEKVRQLERKVYMLLGAAGVAGLLIFLDIFLVGTFMLVFITIMGLILLHLLEIVQHGIATIDQAEGESFVTELSSVRMMEDDTDIENNVVARKMGDDIQRLERNTVYKTRGASWDVRQWSKFKQYYVTTMISAIPAVASYSILIYGLKGKDKIDFTLFQGACIGLSLSIVPIVISFTFSSIYVYERLLGVLVGTREYRIWKFIKIYIVAVTCAASVSMLVVCLYFDSDYADLVDASSDISLLEILSNARFIIMIVAISLMFASFGAVSGYCNYKVVWAILSSSSKLARMKKTADKEKVRQLERKVYMLMGAAGVAGLLIFLDIFFLGFTFMMTLTAIVGLIIIHLLEIIRHGIATIDRKEEQGSVTELSTVEMMDESAAERLESKQVGR